MKKILVELMEHNYSITQSVNWSHSEYNREHQIQFSFSRVFFGVNCNLSFYFVPCAKSFGLDVPDKTTSWITSVCLKIWEES